MKRHSPKWEQQTLCLLRITDAFPSANLGWSHAEGLFRPEASRVQHWSFMRPAKHFYVYIMSNRPRSHVLYTGVTGNLLRRIFEHKNKLVPGFTSRYNLTHLVYYELFHFAGAAIEREKQIKGWSRNKKIALITSVNPKWDDLAAGWGDQFKPDAVRANSVGTAREIPLDKLRAGSRG